MEGRELWLFFFFLGAFFFNWPLLDIFGLSLPSYLFGMWALFIICVGVFVTLAARKKSDI